MLECSMDDMNVPLNRTEPFRGFVTWRALLESFVISETN